MKPGVMTFYKYQGAGNDFLIADNRDGHVREREGVLTACLPDGSLWNKSIADLCDRRYGIGADGLMLLESSREYGFRMRYFNSDGSGGMMCGNGGRCIVAFAADMGIENYDFAASDGFHTAQILSHDGRERIVRLKMKDISEIVRYDVLKGVSVPSDGYFLDTGTRHFVRFVDDLDAYDVVGEGREIRFGAEALQPLGVNVNFVDSADGKLKIRTYEKGVENETYACGTGIVAGCIAAYVSGIQAECVDGRLSYEVQARRDCLIVDFIPGSGSAIAEDLWLTGPAVYVAEVTL